MPYLPQQRVLLPGVQSSDLTSGKIKSGLGKDSLAQGGMDAIASVKVPSGGLASVVFAGIPSGYKNLQIRCMIINTAGGSGNYAQMRFNEDSTSSYSWHLVSGNGSTASVNSVTSGNFVRLDQGLYSNNSNTSPQVTICDIVDYASGTKNKTILTLDGGDANGAGFASMLSGAWYNTAPITSIAIYSYSAGSPSTFGEHSSFALYGTR